MNNESPSARSDDELLRITKSVLSGQGFQVEAVSGTIDLVLGREQLLRRGRGGDEYYP